MESCSHGGKNGKRNRLGIEPMYATAKLTPVPKTNNSVFALNHYHYRFPKCRAWRADGRILWIMHIYWMQTLMKTIPTSLHIFSAIPYDSKSIVANTSSTTERRIPLARICLCKQRAEPTVTTVSREVRDYGCRPDDVYSNFKWEQVGGRQFLSQNQRQESAQTPNTRASILPHLTDHVKPNIN
jgi:hypothetical protein